MRDWVARNAELRPGAPALTSADTAYGERTWEEVEARVAGLAGHLVHELGIQVGDRVAVISNGDPRVFELQFACMRIGAIMVPFNWRLSTYELIQLCGDCSPAVLVNDATWDDLATEVAHSYGLRQRLRWGPDGGAAVADYDQVLGAALPYQPALRYDESRVTHILYTSGTTGRPKGALSTWGTLTWQAINTAYSSRVAEDGGHHLNPMPLFHAGGLNALANPVLHFGGRVTTLRRFKPDEVLAVMASRGVTHYNGIPRMFAEIASCEAFATADLSAMRCGVVAGAVPDEALMQAWQERGLVLQPQYGSTETGPAATAVVSGPHMLDDGIAGSAGWPVTHVELRVVDANGSDASTGEAGEIWVKGPAITPGYWALDPDEYFTDGWYKTGDGGVMDADGKVSIVGRLKEMYKSGGENVYMAEVENVLTRHPAVDDLAITSVPDPRWDEVGMAVVTTKPGATLDLDALRSFGEQFLARYKLPRHLVVVDEIPRNVTGKVSRADLRDQYASTLLSDNVEATETTPTAAMRGATVI